MMAVIGSMAAILVHERKRIREIEAGTETIRQVRRDISEAHRCITRLALLGEGVVGWDETDYRHYHAQLLSTDSLLQAMKPLCREYVRPAQIGTLRSLLTDKETHLRHIMEVMERQDEANSLLVNHLPEVARRAYTCPHREEEEKRAGRLLRRQEDRTGAAIRRGTPRLQRQPDRPAKETGGGDGSIRRQPAHPQPDAEQGTGAADTRPRHAGTGRIRRTRTGHIGGAGTVRQAADRHHLRRHRTAVPLRSCHPPGNQA